MGKVLISIPDRLLEQLDSLAKSLGETRSGFLQRLAEREVAEDNASRRKEIEELLIPGGHLGVDAAELIRWDRDHRDDRHDRFDANDA